MEVTGVIFGQDFGESWVVGEKNKKNQAKLKRMCMYENIILAGIYGIIIYIPYPKGKCTNIYTPQIDKSTFLTSSSAGM